MQMLVFALCECFQSVPLKETFLEEVGFLPRIWSCRNHTNHCQVHAFVPVQAL